MECYAHSFDNWKFEILLQIHRHYYRISGTSKIYIYKLSLYFVSIFCIHFFNWFFCKFLPFFKIYFFIMFIIFFKQWYVWCTVVYSFLSQIFIEILNSRSEFIFLEKLYIIDENRLCFPFPRKKVTQCPNWKFEWKIKKTKHGNSHA